MSREPDTTHKKIELIADGTGSVLVFINGQPIDQFYCDGYDLDSKLERLLEKHLCKYQRPDDELDEDDD